MESKYVGIQEKYINSTDLYKYPSRNINPKDKLSKTYAKLVCESVFSSFMSDKCMIPFGMLTAYDEIRAFGNGKQDPGIYEEYYNTGENEDTLVSSGTETKKLNQERKGTRNIDKRILSPAPRVMDSVKGACLGIDYDVHAETIDPDSIYERERAKSELYSQSKHLDFLNMYMQGAGLPVDSDSKYPKDLDELKLLESLGEFKTPIAKAIEKACKHTYTISNWEKIISKVIEDAVNFNHFAIKEVFNSETCKYEVEYVDITRLIAQYSDKRDYSDSCFFGEIRLKKVSEIRHKLESEGYTEGEIRDLAFSWCGNGTLLGMYGASQNPMAQNFFGAYDGVDAHGTWLYDYWNILVLELVYIENDTEYITYKPNKITGERTSFFGRSSKKNDEVVSTTIKRQYQANWVIGTNVVYDNMISPSQPRDANNKRPMMSYHVFSGQGESITSRLIPIYNNFQISWLKFQNKLQELHDEIMLFDMSVLDRYVTKGDYNGLIKILKNIKRTGFFPYRSLPVNGKYTGGNVKPIDKMPSSMGTQIEESIALWENSFRMIEMVTGFNPASLGGQPNKGEGVGQTEIAVQNTTKILKPLIESIFQIKEDSAQFLAEAIRLAVRNDKKAYDAYARVLGQNDVEALKKSNYEARELGIELIPRPSTDELQSLYRDIETASMPGKDGKPLIRFDVKLYIKEKLMNGANLSDIRLYLSNAIDKEIDRQEQEKQEAIKAQGEQNSQLAQLTSQANIEEEKTKARFKIEIDNNIHKNDLERDWYKYSHERYIKDQDMQMQQMNNQNNPQDAQQQQRPVVTE
jgi:hypothetical protein